MRNTAGFSFKLFGITIVTVPYSKVPLTLDGQLALLEKRMMLIEDKSIARRYLERVSYYRLSAYFHPFRKSTDDAFIDGTSFARVAHLYEFDHRLRLAVLDAIKHVEVAIRTLMVNTFAHHYGPFGHTDPVNFDSRFDHAEWIKELDKEVGRSKETFISHYRTKYDGHPTVPLWIAAEVLQFGSLNYFYKNSLPVVKDRVAAQFGLSSKVLASWLLSLGYVRNLCAHHGRLWNRELAVAPLIPAKDRRWKHPVLMWQDRTFAALLTLRSMLRSIHAGSDWALRVETEFAADFGDPFIARGLGLVGDWTTHPIWRG